MNMTIHYEPLIILFTISFILSLFYFLRPDVVDYPNRGWWGKLLGHTEQERPNRLRMYRFFAFLGMSLSFLIVIYCLWKALEPAINSGP
jgi:hypothetical protein